LDQSLEDKHRAVAAGIGIQWPQLAGALGLSSADVWRIQKQCDGSPDGLMLGKNMPQVKRGYIIQYS